MSDLYWNTNMSQYYSTLSYQYLGPIVSFFLYKLQFSWCNKWPVAHLNFVVPCNSMWEARGGTFTKIVRGCACRTSKIWLSLYQFFTQFPTHQYTILERKAPNFDQIGCFLQKIAQNTPNLCNLGSFVSDENPPITIPNFVKKHPKRQAHICIPCQCENPPPPPGWEETMYFPPCNSSSTIFCTGCLMDF